MKINRHVFYWHKYKIFLKIEKNACIIHFSEGLVHHNTHHSNLTFYIHITIRISILHASIVHQNYLIVLGI